jgi:hypothetical protein
VLISYQQLRECGAEVGHWTVGVQRGKSNRPRRGESLAAARYQPKIKRRIA